MKSEFACRVPSFVFKTEYHNEFKKLTDEDAGRLIKSILDFTEGADVEGLDSTISSSFAFIARSIEWSCNRHLQKMGAIRARESVRRAIARLDSSEGGDT